MARNEIFQASAVIEAEVQPKIIWVVLIAQMISRSRPQFLPMVNFDSVWTARVVELSCNLPFEAIALLCPGGLYGKVNRSLCPSVNINYQRKREHKGCLETNGSSRVQPCRLHSMPRDQHRQMTRCPILRERTTGRSLYFWSGLIRPWLFLKLVSNLKILV